MNKTDKSIPSISELSKKDINADRMDTSVLAEPDPVSQKTDLEADINSKKAEDTLIFGKFKTLEDAQKSYKEAERAITRAAVLEKQLREYEDQAARYEEDALARQAGFTDSLELALDQDVREHELLNYALAARYILPIDQQLEINHLIEECRMDNSPESIARLRRCFSPEVIAMVSVDLAGFRNARQDEYQQRRAKDKQDRINRKLQNFYEQHQSWLDSPARADLFSQALELTNGAADLQTLKLLVDTLEEEAVSKSIKHKNVRRENEQAQDSLMEPADSTVRSPKKKWLTRAEYLKLTPKEEREKYDQIVEQIQLEKQGLLPRMLLK